ncbi:hypothetical protein [Nonlabens dokdonensis]|uniref:Uncharacterized protein n=2 Tax=Nonlabens dokdonensis TaxID=328515 RepID=L7WB45_NONDD|nr:hypothetical protein [Nonlabens dokdonensis]AGC76133.1 hypothetical protein DDD_1006 [Nonlabens dokdonensis DSW-6]
MSKKASTIKPATGQVVHKIRRVSSQEVMDNRSKAYSFLTIE